MKKLQTFDQTLESKTERIFQGIKTSADKIFIFEHLKDLGELVEVYCKENEKKYVLEKEFLKPLIKGGNSRPNKITAGSLFLLFPYLDGKLKNPEAIEKVAPKTWKYLMEHKNILEERENNSFRYSGWYRFGRAQALNEIQKIKIFTPDIAPSPRFSYDSKGEFVFTGGAAGGYGIIPKNDVDFKFLLAILNSIVIAWYISKTSTQMRGGWLSFESRFINSILIPYGQPEIKKEINKLVNEILEETQELPEKDTTSVEAEIDQHVYRLYGLTEVEIEVIESS